jgi:hypothetical protein
MSTPEISAPKRGRMGSAVRVMMRLLVLDDGSARYLEIRPVIISYIVPRYVPRSCK